MPTDIPVVSPGTDDPSQQEILPAGIRWRRLASVPLVMNEAACADLPPELLRPSLAISVAEDPVADGDCTITSYIKVTLTLTGLPMSTEGRTQGTSVGVSSIWGCYGARLWLAANPYHDPRVSRPGTEVNEADYPVITDFEPKLRDLFQGGTVENEVLSGSTGQTTVDRASKSIASTTLGLSVTGGYGTGGGQTTSGPNISATGSISGTRSLEQDYDFSTVSGQSSSKRNATTANISQMFNLLTGYHSGTNAIAIEMYPRPHISQPDFGPLNDFTPGMRAMEGVQEVIAVVSRPNIESSRAGLALTAWLELAYISPLAAHPAEPSASASRLLPDPRHPDQPLLLHFDTQLIRRNYPAPPADSPPTPDDVAQYTQLFPIGGALDAASADIDLSAGDSPASPGVTMLRSFTPRHDQERIGSERYGAVSSTHIRVDIVQRPDIGVGEWVPQIVKDYAVWVKDRDTTPRQPELDGNLQTGQLRLCTSYRVDGNCIKPLDPVRISGRGRETVSRDPQSISTPMKNTGSLRLRLRIPSLDAKGAHYARRVLLATIKNVLSRRPSPDPPPPG